MEKIERVLAFNVATEMTEEDLAKISGGGSTTYTYQRTEYYTNRHGVSDIDFDEVWD